MRSAREIRFRLAQQVANVRLLIAGSTRPRKSPIGELPLPDGNSVALTLRDTPFAREVEELAASITAHRFPILGITVETGPSISWRRDYVHSRETEPKYFRLIPYLDFEQAGDHKNIWELSRHQHLVLLAQAYLLTGNTGFVNEIRSELESWWRQNPFLRGINWASALEVAFRALSWLWLDHLIGGELGSPTRNRLRDGLYQHGGYLEHNLSTYFSPNTHLLGEGIALHALGLKFPDTKWRDLGNQIVAEELARQVRPDGSHFEQSTYYHVYALDFLQFYYILEGQPSEYRDPLRRMARFLASLNGPDGDLSFFGDDDGGRLFHPYGERSAFGRATLTTSAVLFPGEGFPASPNLAPEQAAWLLGPAAVPINPNPNGTTELFRDAGLAVITRPGLHIVIDAGPFGPGGAGHSHADTLSLTVRHRSREILIDAGTFTYVADPRLRDAFRGSASHNTLRIDGLDQADAVKPFRWENKPDVAIREWLPDRTYLDAECRYRTIVHRRRFLLMADLVLVILDEVRGGPGEHSIEQFWHAGEPVDIVSPNRVSIGGTWGCFAAPASPRIQQGWRSRAFGAKSLSAVIGLSWRSELPAVCAAAFVFDGAAPAEDLQISEEGGCVLLSLSGLFSVRFQDEGAPTVTRP